MTPDPYNRVREAFHTVADGLMEWQDPAELTSREYRRLEAIPDRHVYRPYDPQGDVEPFDLDADDRDCWEGTR